MFPGRETFNEKLSHLRIVVYGIRTWSRKKIFKCFARFGIITGISDVTSKGFAFVQFRTEESVLGALQTMNRKSLLGDTITVKRDHGASKKRHRRIPPTKNFRPQKPPKREPLEVESAQLSLSSTSDDRFNSMCEQRSAASSRASSVSTTDISVFEECMSPSSSFGSSETEPLEYEETTSAIVDEANTEEIPMDICIQESSCSASEHSFHSDSTLDLNARIPVSNCSQTDDVKPVIRIEASTQTLRHYLRPQWLRPSGPNDCFVAQQVGTEEYGEKVKSLLTEVGIKHSDLYFENLSDAENPIMEHIENSEEGVYGIFICDTDVKETTISVLSESKLTKNMPLSEAITSLQKHFEAIRATAWYKFRLMKFFLNPMISSLGSLSTEDMQFAIQYVQQTAFADGPGPSSKRRTSCETQARHDVPVFGQT